MGILKINEANSYLKECLVNTVAEELPDKKLKIEPRLLFLSKEQFDKANNINIKYNVLKILTLKFIIIELESVDYIAIIGNNNVKCENDDLEYIDIDESFYIVTAYGAKIGIKKDCKAYDILQAIYEPEKPEIFQGYELDTFKDFFEPIVIYKLPELCQSNIIFKKYVGTFLMYNKDMLLLPFSDNTKQAYLDIFTDTKCINENILSSSVAYCWRYCFLDIYRCLEPKFTYPCIKKLKSSLSLSHTSDIIDNSLYDILGWRVKEEGAMVDLFDCLPQILKTEFARIKKDDEADIIGKRIYKLRNSIVHHYSVENNIEDVRTPLEWDNLICLMLKAIKEIYAIYT